MSALEILQQSGSTLYVTVDVVGKPLAAALGLSLVVERVVELLKNALDLLPTPAGVRRVEPLANATEAVAALERFHEQTAAREADERAAAADAPRVTEALSRISDLRAGLAAATGAERDRLEKEIEELQKLVPPTAGLSEVEERFPRDTILVQPATDPDDGSTLRAFALQAVALAVGIVAARLAQVHLFTPLFQSLSAGAAGPLPGGFATDYVLTGLLVGGGSGPVHMLIRFLGERTVAAPPPVVAEPTPITAAVPPSPAVGPASVALATVAAGSTGEGGGTGTAVSAAPAVVVHSASEWVDLPYDGGVDREKLEAVHHRPANPNLIVFHHTAMPLSSSFADVVRVIHDRKDDKGRPWLTGYHCVVTSDGVSHPFCRWDRYGNHAQGYNLRSLGIALNGNFETDPSVPDSNARGQYGPPRPTSAQLETAARVVALWCWLYKIPVRFGESIIPHSHISPKTCPGTNFPYADFERLVNGFYQAWDNPAVQERIHAFAQKPYLMVA